MERQCKEKEYELVSVPEHSPTELTIIEETVSQTEIPSKRHPRLCTLKNAGMLIALLVLGLMATESFTSIAPSGLMLSSYPMEDKFKFQVHCPISYYTYYNPGGFDFRRLLQTNPYKYGDFEFDSASIDVDFRPDRTYIVSIVSAVSSGEQMTNKTISELRYCGLTRTWNGSCKQPLYTCSTPGPMFDFKVNQVVDVIWVNLLNSSNVPENVINSCLDQNQALNQKCSFATKDFSTETYLDPTQMVHHSQGKTRISPKNWPATTHVHGLQVRPTFDGNPLSWISNNGTRGEGAMSLDDSCYYDNFDRDDEAFRNYMPPNLKFIKEQFNKVSKINRYPNGQNPGNLWYHDHSMRLTAYNAASGLLGTYIIRDPKVEALLPTGDKERFIMKSAGNWAFLNVEHEPNTVYRYRILNNQISGSWPVFFSYQQQCTSQISFTIIGADSSLFNETMPGIYNVTLGPAERVEILIKLDENHSIFYICSSMRMNQVTILLKDDPAYINEQFAAYLITAKKSNPSKTKQLASVQPTLLTDIKTPFALKVPFTDLSTLQDKEISRFRMRPLMATASGLTINGHFDFHKGSSEDPVIGTVEDWYIINTMGGAHPIHVHLVNFQVIEQTKLRTIPAASNPSFKGNCTFYELDFYLRAIRMINSMKIDKLLQSLTKNGIFDYKQFCAVIKSGNYSIDGTLYNWSQLYTSEKINDAMYMINKETEYDTKTLISGINVNDLIKTDSSYLSTIEASNCPTNKTHKYICGKSDNGKPWYRRWKDTAMVDGNTVFRYRIRWTMSDYKKGGPYFHVPVDQLREFPGYVYHCHILAHEDNEMMRSIMLKVPADYVSSTKTSKCRQITWRYKSECLNEQCALPADTKYP